MSNDYFKAQGWFKTYALNSQDSRGVFQQLVKEDEEAFRLASAESDKIKAMMNEKYGPGTVKYGSEIKQPEIKTPQAIFEFSQRNPAAEGGRMLNPVQMGEDRGDRTGFRKPIYVPTKKSYVVNDRTNNLIEDFKIEDYGSKSKAKKAADALDKKISAENEKRRIETSEKNRANFSNKRIDFKKSINTWTQNWMDNNIGNYDLQDADTFIKDMKTDFAKDFNIEAPTKNTAASIEGFPNIGTDAKEGKAVFTPYGIDSIKKPGKSRGTTSYYDSFFRRAFLTNKIQTDEVLKRRISSYLDYATMNKPSGSVALDKLKLKYADTLNNLDDVMYVLSDDTQVVNLAKKNLLSNIFPQYNKFREKKNASAISRKINIAKIEKTLGPKKLKELLNGGTSINKFLVDEGKTLKKFFPSMKELPLDLRYSIDHNIGISELAKLSKSDMEKGLNSLIGMSNKRNTDLGWKGYSVIKKNLINKIQQGKNVSGNIDKLNEITEKAYPEELKGKKAYNLVNGKLTFTEDFTFRTNPEERFKSYFEEINKTKEGKAAIKKDFGSLKEIEAYITDRTGKVKQPSFIGVSSGFNTDLISEDLKKIVNSEGFKTFKAKIANPALKTAVGVAKLPTKIFGAADLVLGYFDYTNNRQKGFSKEDSTKHMVDAVLFGATSFGEKGDIEGVRKIANKNGMSNEVFDNLMAVNTNQKAMIDRINKSKAEFNESMDIIESKTSDPVTEKLRIQKLKVDTKEFLTNTMKDIVDDSRSLNTNLQVQEAGAPININVDNQKAFKDLGSSSREFVQTRIDASDPKVFEQGDTTMGKIGSTIKETVMQPDFYTGFFKQTKAQKDREDMEKLKIQDPTMYYKMLMSEGVDPRIKLNIPVQLEFEQKYPQFGTQYSDSLTQNKAEGGITGLRSKYEYKK